MAKRVTISAVGAAPPPAPHGMSGQELVEHMIEFWRGKIAQVLPDKPDLIVLPEMCDRYNNHTMEQKLEYRTLRGDSTLEFLQELASQHQCYIAYASAREAKDGTWRNAMLMIDRGGKVCGVYHKNHVVIGETTHSNILCGADAPVIECDFGRVGTAICFDLNFDELRAKYQASRPDVIIFPSMYHGGIMQPYWAYSCRAYFVGCTGIANLPSEIWSPVGHRIATSTNYFDFVTATVNLDYRVVHLDENWGRLRAAKQKYGRDFIYFDPGQLGAVLITSESDERSIDDIVREFEIELLDDYFARSLAHHHNPSHIEPR